MYCLVLLEIFLAYIAESNFSTFAYIHNDDQPGDIPSSTWGYCSMKTAYAMAKEMEWEAFSLICEASLCKLLTSSSFNESLHQVYSIRPDFIFEDLHDAFLRTNEERNIYLMNVVLAASGDMMSKILDMANTFDVLLNQHDFFVYRYKWLLIPTPQRYWGFTRSIRDLINVAAISSQKTNSCVTNIYTSYFERFRSMKRIGVHRNEKIYLQDEIFPNIKYQLNGKHLLLGTNYWYAFMSKNISANGDITYWGICAEIADALALALNFTYTFIEPPDMKWGSINENGTWNGLAGLLQRRDVDMTVATTSNVPERAKDMDFSGVAFYVENLVILYKKPNPLDSTLSLLLKPYQMIVWYFALASLFVGSITFSVINKYSLDRSDHSLAGFGKAFWYIFGMSMLQGQPEDTKSISSRIVVSIWWIFVIVFTSTYMGNLVAILSINKVTPPFTGLQDLAEQDFFTFGMLSGTSTVSAFKESTIPSWKSTYRKMEEFIEQGLDVLSSNHTWHKNMLQTTNYAYLTDMTAAEYFIAENCDFTIAPETFKTLHYSIGLQKNSAYTDEVTDVIKYLHSQGLLQHWKKKLWPAMSSCKPKGAIVLTLYHTQGIFYVLFLSLSIALAVLVVEVALSKTTLISFLKSQMIRGKENGKWFMSKVLSFCGLSCIRK